MQTYRCDFYGNTGFRSWQTEIISRSPQNAAKQAQSLAAREAGQVANRGARGTVALRDDQGNVIFQRRV